MALAALVTYPAGKIPFLWVDDPTPVRAPGPGGDPISVIIALPLRDGFALVADPAQPPAPTVTSWRVELDATGLLRVCSPRDTPEQSFVSDLQLATPPGWREHAHRLGAVLLLVGCGLQLDDAAHLEENAAACARAGLLISAVVAYAETQPGGRPRP
ncbi:hypothetical protein GCM10010156_72860 [Planobispora rosea]|uniref:Uncharacterized protein n=2 Tax=Planobispora rosea TaxID=35762 RepID=A0A8J3SA63_PLARO|nr:hypothetical protein GCM10010156_72860 [Planobispora rosea]GIH88902.1 hypothetical protein Pro02_73100 [Planobispora rosea]